MFTFGRFNTHHKDWLLYGIDRPGELRYNFSMANDLTQMVNFPTWIPVCDSHVLFFWIYFFLLTLVFVLQWLYLHSEIFDHVVALIFKLNAPPAAGEFCE